MKKTYIYILKRLYQSSVQHVSAVDNCRTAVNASPTYSWRVYVGVISFFLLFLCAGAWANVTYRWDFLNGADYDYDSSVLEVDETPPGYAQLVLQPEKAHHDTLADYSDFGTSNKNVAFGIPVSLLLTKSGASTYNSQGIFTSRIHYSPRDWNFLTVRASSVDHMPQLPSYIAASYRMDNDNWWDDVSMACAVGVNNPAFTTDSKVGSHAGLFDKGGYVRLRYPDIVNGKSELTIACWFKLYRYDNYAGIVFSRDKTAGNMIGFMLDTTGKVGFNVVSSSGGNSGIFVPVELNKWYFLVGTWSSSGDKCARIYLNAVLAGTAGNPYSTLIQQTEPFHVAANISGTTIYTMRGIVDEILICSKQFSAGEIAQMYRGYYMTKPLRFQVRSGVDPGDVLTKDFVGPDGTTNSVYTRMKETLVDCDDFDTQNDYAQYRAYFYSSRDNKKTPYLEAVGMFDNRGEGGLDYTYLDWKGGEAEYTLNVTNTYVSPNQSYVGLSKKRNGGYYTNGLYTSRAINMGASVDWKRIEWEQGGAEVAYGISGVVGLYHCRNSWADASGYGHGGNNHGGVTYTQHGKLGGVSAIFNGTSDYVDSFGIESNQTVEFWINNVNVNDAIMEWSAGKYLCISNRVIKAVGFGGNVSAIFVNGSDISPKLAGGWNHVAMILNNLVGSSGFTVGRANGDYMEGLIDELVVYNRKAWSAEIREHYMRGRKDLAGNMKFQTRAANTLTALATNLFVGPGGDPALWHESADWVACGPGQYLQYRVFLEGSGEATPGLASVTLFYDILMFSFMDSGPDIFYQGTFHDGQTRWYGDAMNMRDLTALEPPAMDTYFFPTLKGLWHLDETIWGQTKDEVSGLFETPVGAQPSSAAKIGLNCGYFDGIDDKLPLGSPALGSSPFSISLWMKSDHTNRSSLLSTFTAPGSQEITLELNTDGGIVSNVIMGAVGFIINDGVNGEKMVVSSRKGLNDWRWHNVIGIRNANQMLLYIDGDLVGVTQIGESYGNIGGAGPVLGYSADSTNYLGLIDEVAVFGHALTRSEIGQVSSAGCQTRYTGVLYGPTVDATEPAIWDTLTWSSHGVYGNAVSTSDVAVVGLWHLDETSGQAIDSSGNNNHGNVAGTQGIAGRFVKCVRFNGTTDKITGIADDFVLENSVLSVEAWVYADDVVNRAVFDKRNATRGYALGLDLNGKPYFWVGDDGAGVAATGYGVLRSGEWMHLAGTYDGKDVRVYVNGEMYGRAVLDSLDASLDAGTASIGADYTGVKNFKGLIDEVVVHDRALLSAEMLDHYKAGIGKLRFQARSWSPVPVTAGSFVGPGTNINTYFTEWYGSDLMSAITLGQYMQYKAFIGTEDHKYPPVFHGVGIDYSRYSSDDPTIAPFESVGYSFHGLLLSADHLRTTETRTAVKYQISGDPDGPGMRWFYWDGSHWAEEDLLGPMPVYDFQANDITTISANLRSLYDEYYDKQGGLFRFRAFLHSDGDYQQKLDWFDLTASEGRIVLTAPDGDETNDLAWITGAPYDITWDYAGNVAGSLKVEYAVNVDLGTNWQTIATGVDATSRTTAWTTPDIESEYCLVQLTHQTDSTIWDVSDSVFHLVKKYVIIQHNGGLPTWYIGETNKIMWGAAQGLGNAKLQFSHNGTWTTTNAVLIISGVSSSGGVMTNEYDWYLPLPVVNPNLISETAELRVSTPGGGYYDDSDAPFIMAGAVVTDPWPDKTVKKDEVTAYTLKWKSAGCGPSVNIYLQSVSNGNWTVIGSNVVNSSGYNSYAWMVTNQPTEEAKIKIESTTDPRAKGLSGRFVIAAIDLIQPQGKFNPADSDKWLMGTTQSIMWVSAGASDFVNIHYSTNSGATTNGWMLIAADVPNDNTAGITNIYNWPVAENPSRYTRIRIQDAQPPYELDTMSKFDFHIAGVKVVYPNGPISQEWPKDENRSITWNYNEVGNNCIVDFSYDGGVTWTNVGQVGFIDGAVDFIPEYPSVRGLVRIKAVDPSPFVNVLDRSDNYFAVSGVRVEAPEMGDEYTIGTTNSIQWLAAATHAPGFLADIYYAADGVTVDTNAIGLGVIFGEAFPSLTTSEWIVEPTRKPSSIARVKVQCGDLSAFSEPFTLRGIRIDSPALGNIWESGDQTISWTYAGIEETVEADVYVSTEGPGGPFDQQVNAYRPTMSDDGIVWMVQIPDDIEPTVNAVIKVITVAPTGHVDVGYTAYSDIFTLKGLKVLWPSNSEAFTLGQTHQIRWRAAEAGSLADVYYSSDGGSKYDQTAITQAVQSVNGYNVIDWNVERSRTPSANARIKVRTLSGVQDVSDPFILNGIKIMVPQKGDIFAQNELTNMLSWVVVGDAGPYQVSYVKDGAVYPIALVADKFLNWAIPTNAIGTNIQIIVSGVYSATSDVFEVVDRPKILMSTPQEGEFWRVTETNYITWRRAGSMEDDFSIYYTLKFGGVYNVTNEITGYPITYDDNARLYIMPWEIPDNLTQAKIIVKHNTRTNIYDTSKEFNICGKFLVWDPAGPESPVGQELFALKPTPVSWRTKGSVSKVNLYYSVTPPYRASSWVKATDVPLDNNYNNNGTWRSTTKSWTVAKLQSDQAMFRVQEAAYTNRFDAGTVGPFDDSDMSFIIRYYKVFWEIFDSVTSTNLDNLSVVDSSGFSESGLSCIKPNTIYFEYPWGTWNTEWYREYFHDEVVMYWEAENLDISAPGPSVWTQKVYMSRSEIEPEYHVMASFSYEATNQTFTIHSWLERGGNILDKPASCTISVYRSDGSIIDEVDGGTPLPNGVFWTVWDASALSSREVYFAKVEIKFSGFSYSSGLTFALRVSVGEEIRYLIEETRDEITNAVGGVDSRLADHETAQSIFRSRTGSMLDTVTNDTDNIMVSLGSITNLPDVIAALSNVVAKSDTMTNMTLISDSISDIKSVITNVIKDTVSTRGRILTRPTTVLFGSTNAILYKTRPDVNVSITVDEPGGYSNTMTQVASSLGIYEHYLVADWGTNSYRVTCSDPETSDAIILKVVGTDVDALPPMLVQIGSNIANLESIITNMSFVMRDITNVSAMVVSLSNSLISVEYQITNMLGGTVLGDIQDVASNVNLLTNQLNGMDWSEINDLAVEIAGITNQLGGMDWTEINDMAVEIAGITNQLGGMDWDDVVTMSGDVDALASDFSGVDWDKVQDLNVGMENITDRLGGINWDDIVKISAEVAKIDESVGDMDWTKVEDISSKLAGIETAVGVLENAEVDLSPALSMLGDIENRFGSVYDSSSEDSLFGRIASVSSQLGNVGESADEASGKAGQAKTQASTAATGVQALQAALADNDINASMSALDSLKRSLAQVYNTVNEIPKGVKVSQLYGQIADVVATLNDLAGSEGYKNIMNMQEYNIEGSGGGEGADETTIAALTASLEDVKGSMSFMQKILDEQVYQPVIEEQFIGIE